MSGQIGHSLSPCLTTLMDNKLCFVSTTLDEHDSESTYSYYELDLDGSGLIKKFELKFDSGFAMNERLVSSFKRTVH